MRTVTAAVAMVVGIVAAAGALTRQPARETAPKPETPQAERSMPATPASIPGGMMGMGMMDPMMGPQMMGGMHPLAPAALTVAADGSVYVVRAGILYKYSPDLRLLASTELPAASMAGPAGRGAASSRESVFRNDGR
jgi:hypothetical protein